MISIKVGENRVEWKNEINELTFKEFDIINSILFDEEKTEIDKEIEIIHYLSGLDKDFIESWDFVDFEQINNFMFNELPTIQNEYEKINLSARQIHNIEKIIKNDDYKITRMVADILKIDYKDLLDKNVIKHYSLILSLSSSLSNYYSLLINKTLNEVNPISRNK